MVLLATSSIVAEAWRFMDGLQVMMLVSPCLATSNQYISSTCRGLLENYCSTYLLRPISIRLFPTTSHIQLTLLM